MKHLFGFKSLVVVSLISVISSAAAYSSEVSLLLSEVENESIAVIASALSFGAHVDSQHTYYKFIDGEHLKLEDRTALHEAVNEEKVAIIRLLLEKGANVNAVCNIKYDDGTAYLNRSALHIAASHGHDEIVTMLLAVPDIDINLEYEEIQRDGESVFNTAFGIAVEWSYNDIAKALLLAGFDRDKGLNLATECENQEIVDFIEMELGQILFSIR